MVEWSELNDWAAGSVYHPRVAAGDEGETPVSEGSMQGVDSDLFTEN